MFACVCTFTSYLIPFTFPLYPPYCLFFLLLFSPLNLCYYLFFSSLTFYLSHFLPYLRPFFLPPSLLPFIFPSIFVFSSLSLQEVDHPNIIKLREVFFGSRTVYLVMELCQGGELFDEITHNAQRGLGEVRVCECVFVVCVCVSHMLLI